MTDELESLWALRGEAIYAVEAWQHFVASQNRVNPEPHILAFNQLREFMDRLDRAISRSTPA